MRSPTFASARVEIRNARPLVGVLDQLVSAGSNVVLTIIVARAVSVERFGAFGVVMIVFSIVIGATRALLGEQLLTRDPDSAACRPRDIAADGAILGTACGGAVAMAALAVPSLRSPLLVLAALLPMLVCQDALRYWGFSEGRAAFVLVLDAVWLLLVVVGFLMALVDAWRPTLSTALVLWGSSSALSLVLAYLVLGRGAMGRGEAPSRPLRQVRETFAIGRLYLVQFATTYAATALAFAVAPAVMGLREAGQLRAAFFSFSAVNVLVAAATTVGVTLLVRRSTHSSIGPLVFAESAFLSLFVIANIAVILYVPDSIGRAVLGASFEGAQRFSVPVGLGVTLSVFGLGPLAGLRAAGLARELTHARLWFAVTAPVLCLAFAMYDGRSARGFALGWLVSNFVGTAALWIYWGRSGNTAHIERT